MDEQIWKADPERLSLLFGLEQTRAEPPADYFVREELERLLHVSVGTNTRQTIADILAHDMPPFDSLALAKQIVKQSDVAGNTLVSREVATYAYYACIAAGIVKHHTLLTELPEEDVRSGLEWADAQTWAPGWLRQLIAASRAQFNHPS